MNRVNFSQKNSRDFKVPPAQLLFYLTALMGTFTFIPAQAENAVPQALTLSPARPYAEINFPPGQSTLDPFAKEKLDTMLRETKLRSTIDRVQVVTYGDPATGRDATAPDTNLAARRASAVEDYLRTRDAGLSVYTQDATQKPTALRDLTSRVGPILSQALSQEGITKDKGSRVVVVLVTRED